MSYQQVQLKAIADAIREKDGTTASIMPIDFPDRIRALNIEAGVSVAKTKNMTPKVTVSNTFNDYAYSPELGIYVLVAKNSDRIVYTYDFITFYSSPLPYTTVKLLLDPFVNYLNGAFVILDATTGHLISENNKFEYLYSLDGIEWSVKYIDNYIAGLMFSSNNQFFIATAFTATSQSSLYYLLKSLDGLTWSLLGEVGSGSIPSSIIFTEGTKWVHDRFVSIRNQDNWIASISYYSFDGVNWQQVDSEDNGAEESIRTSIFPDLLIDPNPGGGVHSRYLLKGWGVVIRDLVYFGGKYIMSFAIHEASLYRKVLDSDDWSNVSSDIAPVYNVGNYLLTSSDFTNWEYVELPSFKFNFTLISEDASKNASRLFLINDYIVGTCGEYIFYGKSLNSVTWVDPLDDVNWGGGHPYDITSEDNANILILPYHGNLTKIFTIAELQVTTAPTKTTYNVGETFNPAGMSLTLVLADGTTHEVDSTKLSYSSEPLKAGQKYVTVSYEFDNTPSESQED